MRRLFDASVLAYFEQVQGLSVEGAGLRLAVYRSRKRAEPEQLRDFLEEAAAVLQLFTS